MKVKNYLSQSNIFQMLADKGFSFHSVTPDELNTAFLYKYGNFDVIEEETPIQNFVNIVYITCADIWKNYESLLGDMDTTTRKSTRNAKEGKTENTVNQIDSATKVYGFDSETGVDKDSETKTMKTDISTNGNRSIDFSETTGLPIENVTKTINGKRKLNYINCILEDVADLLIMPYCMAE